MRNKWKRKENKNENKYENENKPSPMFMILIVWQLSEMGTVKQVILIFSDLQILGDGGP